MTPRQTMLDPLRDPKDHSAPEQSGPNLQPHSRGLRENPRLSVGQMTRHQSSFVIPYEHSAQELECLSEKQGLSRGLVVALCWLSPWRL
jgi:hypothetical protein